MKNRLGKGGSSLLKKGYLGSFTKMTVLFDLILISTVVFLTVFTARSYVSVVKEQEVTIGNEKTEELLNYFQGKCDRIDGLVRYMHSSDFSEIMSEVSENPEAFYDYDNISFMSVFLAAAHAADRDFSDIIIVTADDAERGHSYSFTEKGWAEIDAGFRFKELPEAERLLNSEGNDIIFYDDPSEYCLKQREPVVSFMGKIYDTDAVSAKKPVGLYIFNIPVGTVDSVMPSESHMSLASLRVVNGWGNVVYSRPHDGEGEAYIREEENDKINRIEQNLTDGRLTVISELSEKVIYAEVRRVQTPVFLVCVLAIALTILLSALISRYFSRRIGLLTDSMLLVEKGDLSARIPEEGNDEIASLSRSFNVMCEKLNGYIDSVYEAELQRKNAEINALQMQINPHFLYNTLESIKAAAVKEGDERTPEMIVLLGNMFRMISRTDERFVTIEDELEYINTYLKLQSYRYDDFFDIDVK
nr:histidine kinase [Lachnospiraceae bacterium]